MLSRTASISQARHRWTLLVSMTENGGSELPGCVAVQTELRLSLPEPLSGPLRYSMIAANRQITGISYVLRIIVKQPSDKRQP